MKYRRLTTDELAELETEFVRFLAVQSIPADEWEKIKATDSARMGQLLDKFSEVVYEKVIANLTYLEYRTPKDIKTFYCTENTIYLIGLVAEGTTAIDFTQHPTREEMLQHFQDPQARLKIYHAKKDYEPDRQTELFRLMENGALITPDGGMYKILQEFVQQSSN